MAIFHSCVTSYSMKGLGSKPAAKTIKAIMKVWLVHIPFIVLDKKNMIYETKKITYLLTYLLKTTQHQFDLYSLNSIQKYI